MVRTLIVRRTVQRWCSRPAVNPCATSRFPAHAWSECSLICWRCVKKARSWSCYELSAEHGIGDVRSPSVDDVGSLESVALGSTVGGMHRSRGSGQAFDEARKDPDASYRITESAGADSKARYDENERVRKLDCNESTPGAPAAGKDCDEYPFRSSAEGAARYLYEGTGDEFKDDFSVRYIDSAENQEAGRRLGAWYHNDRILNWEAFTVSIGD